MRYTPAGVQALDCRLAQQTTAIEDGQPRRISVEIKALAIGAIVRSLNDLTLGAEATFAGFLANARNGRGLLFHITSLTPAPATSPNPSDTKEVNHAPTQR